MMTGLKRILEDVVEREFKLGGVLSKRAIEKLDSYQARQYRTFIVLYAILFLVVALGLFVLVWYVDKPSQMAAVFGVMGISIGGAVEMMRRIWTQWSQLQLILILLEDAAEDEVKALLDKLINKL